MDIEERGLLFGNTTNTLASDVFDLSMRDAEIEVPKKSAAPSKTIIVQKARTFRRTRSQTSQAKELAHVAVNFKKNAKKSATVGRRTGRSSAVIDLT